MKVEFLVNTDIGDGRQIFIAASEFNKAAKDEEEERRLFYVGMTRAENSLTISYARERFEYGAVRSKNPSKYIFEIPEENMVIIDA